MDTRIWHKVAGKNLSCDRILRRWKVIDFSNLSVFVK